MAQNIYDDAGFFSGYAALPRSQFGLEAAPEWPELRAMVGSVAGARVADLGCGYGWFCRWAAAEGAASVLGLDLSERMLARAREFPTDARITYERADLENLDLADRRFDLVYSSLTLHYLPDLGPLLRAVRGAMDPGGRVVCSVEHPVLTAPTTTEFVTQDGDVIWPLSHFADEGPRVTNWLADGVVKHHRTAATFVRELVAAGFVVDGLGEWTPNAADLHEHPEWARERHRPFFLLLSARTV